MSTTSKRLAAQQLREARQRHREQGKRLREAERLARGTQTETERVEAYQAEKRAGERAVKIPPVANWPRRTRAVKDPYRFLRAYFAELFFQPFTRNRREIVEAIMRAAQYGGDQAIAAPRGEGKTTIIECLTIFCMLTGVLRFPLVCSKTAEDAGRLLSNIKRQLEENEKLAADFPEVCIPVRALEGAPQRANMQTVAGERTRIKWSGNHIMLPTIPREVLERDCQMLPAGAVLATRGMDAAIRGVRYGALRPDLAILDDPETRESAQSEKQREDREKIIEGDVGGLGGPTRRVARVMLTTIMHHDCLSFRYTDPTQKPSWHGKRYRLIEEMPDRTDLWDEYVSQRQAGQQDGDPHARRAHRLYRKDRKEMDRGAVLSNPDRYMKTKLPDGSRQELSALQACYNVIADWGWEHFATEYQNEPPQEEEPEGFKLTAHRVKKQLSLYPKGVVPPECRVLTGAIDVGKYACHWVVDAWRADATGYRVDYGVQEVWGLATDSDDRAVDQAILRALNDWRETTLAKPYCEADGEERPIDLVLIDAHYRMEAVYRFCAEVGERGYRPAWGIGQSGDGATRASFTMPRQDQKTKKLGDHWFVSKQPSGIWLVCIDSDHWKRWKWDRYMTPTDRPGTFLLYGDTGSIHVAMSKHLTAEEEVEEFIRGKGLKRVWKQISRNNHWFDADYMSAVAASMLGIRLLGARAPAAPRRVRLSELKRQKDNERAQRQTETTSRR